MEIPEGRLFDLNDYGSYGLGSRKNVRSKKLKLYRGLSSSEFQLMSDELAKENKATWNQILRRRLGGDFKYPHELDRAIQTLQKNQRMEYQYFTDSKSIAESYAKKVGGLLVEVTVSAKDLAKHFDLEFQNFGRRKKLFEIVYRIKGSTLKKFCKTWRLKIRRGGQLFARIHGHTVRGT